MGRYWSARREPFRAIPARLGEANTLQALGDLERMEAHYAEARQHYTAALALFRAIPDQVGILNTLYSGFLLGKAEGNQAAACHQLGEAIALAERIPAFANHRVTENWRQIYARDCEAPSAPAQSTLPRESVETLAGNTVAVKTDAAEHFLNWRKQLQDARADFAGRGTDYAIEVEFADALLAVLDGQPASLPAGNPYASVIDKVNAAIATYRAEHGR